MAKYFQHNIGWSDGIYFRIRNIVSIPTLSTLFASKPFVNQNENFYEQEHFLRKHLLFNDYNEQGLHAEAHAQRW